MLNLTMHNFTLSNRSLTHLLQSPNWANIKNNWNHEFLGFYEGDRMLGSALVLKKKLGFGLSLWYIPRGIITDYRYIQTTVEPSLVELKKYARRKRAILVKLDPFLKYKEKELAENPLHLFDRSILANKFTDNMTDTIQPRVNATIYANDFLSGEYKLPKKTKQLIKTSYNQHVRVVHGRYELLEDLTSMIKLTSNHKDLNLRGKDYYKKLLDNYEKAYITVAYLDINKRMLDNIPTSEFQFLITKNYTSSIPIAATLTVVYEETAELLYSGMNYDFRKYNGAVVSWYEAINYSFNNYKCKFINLGGVENNLDGGLYNFKKKFNPTIEYFSNEYDILTIPILSRIFRYVYRKKKG